MARVEAERRARAEAEKKARSRPTGAPRAEAEKREAARQQETETAAAAGRIPRTAKPEALRSFAAAQGHITLPAAGRIVRQFADATETGAPSRGIVIETRPDAQIVAPFDGQVVFRRTVPRLRPNLDHRARRGLSYSPRRIIPDRRRPEPMAAGRRAGRRHGPARPTASPALSGTPAARPTDQPAAVVRRLTTGR